MGEGFILVSHDCLALQTALHGSLGCGALIGCLHGSARETAAGLRSGWPLMLPPSTSPIGQRIPATSVSPWQHVGCSDQAPRPTAADQGASAKKKAVPQESRCVLLQAGVFRAAAGNTPWQAARAHNRARLAQRARSWPLANQIRGTEQGLGPFRVPGWLFGMGVEVLGTSSFPAVENVEAIGRPQRPITALVQRRASALQRLCAQGGVIMR